MDFSWLRDLFNWIVQVNSVISNFSSVLGSVTVLGAGVGFVLSRRDSGFGPKYDTTGRYNKFFKLVARKLSAGDEPTKSLNPLRAEAFAAFATYESTKSPDHLRYRAHFFSDGSFGVYLYHISIDAPAVSRLLKDRESEIRTALGFDQKPGFFRRLLRRSNRIGELKWEPVQQKNQGTVYRPVLSYPDEINITSAGRKLIRLSDWTATYLVKFQQIFDQQVPEERQELKRNQAADAFPVPATMAQ